MRHNNVRYDELNAIFIFRKFLNTIASIVSC